MFPIKNTLKSVLKNTTITIVIILVAWVIFDPCYGSNRTSNGKVYRSSSPKTAEVLDFLKNISLDFANRVKADNPELGNNLIKRLVNTTFIELNHNEYSTLWAWNADKGREMAFRFYKENGELEPHEEQICSLLHELAHSVVSQYDHEIEWQNMNNYFQNFRFGDGKIKDYYIRLLVNEELYKGFQINQFAECDGS